MGWPQALSACPSVEASGIGPPSQVIPGRPAWRWRPLPETTSEVWWVVSAQRLTERAPAAARVTPLSRGLWSELSLSRRLRGGGPTRPQGDPAPGRGHHPGPAEHRQGRAPRHAVPTASPPWAPAVWRLSAPCVWGGHRPRLTEDPTQAQGAGLLRPHGEAVTPGDTTGPSREPGQRARPRFLARVSVWLWPSLDCVLYNICFPQHFRSGGWRVARAQPTPAWPEPRATPQPGH